MGLVIPSVDFGFMEALVADSTKAQARGLARQTNTQPLRDQGYDQRLGPIDRGLIRPIGP
jgi:hypothetical protein